MLGDDIREALPDLRAQAESLMTEQCVIERLNGTAYNPVTHKDEPVWEHVYTGKCRIRPASGTTAASLAQVFGQQINSISHLGSLPFGTVGVKASDRVTVTESGDPGQVGYRYTILAVETGALSTVRRFVATDDQG